MVEFVKVQYTGGTGAVPTSTIVLRLNGKKISESACGNGSIDSLVKAANRCVWGDDVEQWPVQLKELAINSLTNGSSAQGQAVVTIGLKFNSEQPITESAIHEDVIEAAARAYVLAMDRYLVIQKGGDEI